MTVLFFNVNLIHRKILFRLKRVPIGQAVSSALESLNYKVVPCDDHSVSMTIAVNICDPVSLKHDIVLASRFKNQGTNEKILQTIFSNTFSNTLNEYYGILIQISQKFVPKGSIVLFHNYFPLAVSSRTTYNSL